MNIDKIIRVGPIYLLVFQVLPRLLRKILLSWCLPAAPWWYLTTSGSTLPASANPPNPLILMMTASDYQPWLSSCSLVGYTHHASPMYQGRGGGKERRLALINCDSLTNNNFNVNNSAHANGGPCLCIFMLCVTVTRLSNGISRKSCLSNNTYMHIQGNQRWSDGWTDRWADPIMNRQTDSQIYYKWIDRQINW